MGMMCKHEATLALYDDEKHHGHGPEHTKRHGHDLIKTKHLGHDIIKLKHSGDGPITELSIMGTC